MASHDVIADVLCELGDADSNRSADSVIGCLDEAGYVIVPKTDALPKPIDRETVMNKALEIIARELNETSWANATHGVANADEWREWVTNAKDLVQELEEAGYAIVPNNDLELGLEIEHALEVDALKKERAEMIEVLRELYSAGENNNTATLTTHTRTSSGWRAEFAAAARYRQAKLAVETVLAKIDGGDLEGEE